MEPIPHSAGPDRISLVVGIDFTDASDYALRLAENLVRSLGPLAELHLVYVTPPPYWPIVPGSDAPAFVPEPGFPPNAYTYTC